jgi:hypothetical protein
MLSHHARAGFALATPASVDVAHRLGLRPAVVAAIADARISVPATISRAFNSSLPNFGITGHVKPLKEPHLKLENHGLNVGQRQHCA